MTYSIPARLTLLRHAMQKRSIDACLIPSADPHLSEYLPPCWQGREVFSGFTGSVATLIVTADFAGLWVDSRYWEQAEIELHGSGIQMMKILSSATSGHIDWLATNLQANQVLSVDGNVLSLAGARLLQNALNAKLVKIQTDIDLLEDVWTDRPGLPTAPIYQHPAPYAVVSRREKLAQVRQAMSEKAVQWHFISTVDDIAWLLNLRGSDVNYNPVFVSHLLLSATSATLFIPLDKVPSDVAQALAADGVLLQAYSGAAASLAQLSAGEAVLVDPRRITFGFREAIAKHCNVIEAINPSVFFKSRKTPQEAQFVREAMEQDGAALCEFFAWYENAINDEQQAISELTIDEKICAARAMQAHFVCPSFATIAGFNGNGAMPHYRATDISFAQIKGDGLLLIDSGGQYYNGTTDITRVVGVGKVTDAQKRDFTLVLKGMIALSRMKFPYGTLSPTLDVIARAPIWAEGVNFGHGTGHGVGYFLNVHEGPQSISGVMPETHMKMEVGMITSNEPGIYRPGKWGIRIENLLLCVPAESTEFGVYLKFETLTLCPIDTRLIAPEQITQEEVNWLNEYHELVRSRLIDHVEGNAKKWLIERTEPIEL